MPLTTIEHTLTWYVIRDGKARMGSAEELRRQVPGPVVVIGPDSYDWLGVPMLREGQIGGALVVQSYQQGIGYTDEDLALLEFVGSHILTALERKQGKQDLEAARAVAHACSWPRPTGDCSWKFSSASVPNTCRRRCSRSPSWPRPISARTSSTAACTRWWASCSMRENFFIGAALRRSARS